MTCTIVVICCTNVSFRMNGLVMYVYIFSFYGASRCIWKLGEDRCHFSFIVHLTMKQVLFALLFVLLYSCPTSMSLLLNIFFCLVKQ